jgi:hypothetical protein
MSDTDATRLLRETRLEAAVRLLKHAGSEVDSVAVEAMIQGYEIQASRMQTAGKTGEAWRLARRAAALDGLLQHGPDPARMVAEVELPEGYVGKVLMVRVAASTMP